MILLLQHYTTISLSIPNTHYNPPSALLTWSSPITLATATWYLLSFQSLLSITLSIALIHSTLHLPLMIIIQYIKSCAKYNCAKCHKVPHISNRGPLCYITLPLSKPLNLLGTWTRLLVGRNISSPPSPSTSIFMDLVEAMVHLTTSPSSPSSSIIMAFGRGYGRLHT